MPSPKSGTVAGSLGRERWWEKVGFFYASHGPQTRQVKSIPEIVDDNSGNCLSFSGFSTCFLGVATVCDATGVSPKFMAV